MFIVQRQSDYGHFVEVWLSNSNDFANTPSTPGFMADHVFVFFFPEAHNWPAGQVPFSVIYYIILP
jgi:hypothetical protein